MLKFLVVNDPHLSDKAPLRRTSTYTEDILAKLEEVVLIAKSREVNAIIFTGDIFHQKVAVRVSHALTNIVLSYFQRFSEIAHVFVVPGNHDLAEDSLSTIYRQPIGALVGMPRITLLFKPVEFCGVRLVPVPGLSTVTEKDFPQTHDWANIIIIAHAPIVLEEKSYPFPVIYGQSIVGSARAIVYGHYHNPLSTSVSIKHPVYLGYTTFVNPGALSRGSISQDDLNRVPQVALVSWHKPNVLTSLFPQVDVEYVPIKCAKPASQVFLIEQAMAEKQKEVTIDEFLTSLGSATVELVSRESLMLAISGSTVDEPVRARAKQVLESVSV